MAPVNYTYVVGVDEVGRGPLAGPVTVCAVLAAKNLDLTKHFPGLDDSKRLTAKKREEIFSAAKLAVAYGDIKYVLSFESAATIDRVGIAPAIESALASCFRVLSPVRGATHVFLDGLLHAPREYSQKTVIHGDALIPAISLASVIAKVSRDTLMNELAIEYPHYGFERHKGYGTAAHIAAIRTHGPCPLHRRSFLTKILQEG